MTHRGRRKRSTTTDAHGRAAAPAERQRRRPGRAARRRRAWPSRRPKAACRSRRPRAACRSRPGSAGVQEPPAADGVQRRRRGGRRRRRCGATAGSRRRRRRAPHRAGYWISLGVGAAALVALLRAAELRAAGDLQDAADQLLPAADPDPGGARLHRDGPGDADRGGGGGRAGRLPAGHRLPAAHLRRGQGKRLPHRQDLGDGVLAVRRLGHLLGRLRAAGRAGAGRALGAVDEPDARPSSCCCRR